MGGGGFVTLPRVRSAETIRDALDAGRLPCVLVIAAPAAPAAATLGRVRCEGKVLVASLHPVSLERFGPVDALEPPVGEAYRLHDVDRGDALRNVTSAVAHEASTEPGRSPWTTYVRLPWRRRLR